MPKDPFRSLWQNNFSKINFWRFFIIYWLLIIVSQKSTFEKCFHRSLTKLALRKHVESLIVDFTRKNKVCTCKNQIPSYIIGRSWLLINIAKPFELTSIFTKPFPFAFSSRSVTIFSIMYQFSLHLLLFSHLLFLLATFLLLFSASNF